MDLIVLVTTVHCSKEAPAGILKYNTTRSITAIHCFTAGRSFRSNDKYITEAPRTKSKPTIFRVPMSGAGGQAAAASHDCCKHHRPKNPHFPPSVCRLLVSGNILSWKDRLTYISGHSLSGSDERWGRVGVSGMRLEETRSTRCRIWTIERGKTLDLDVARVLSWSGGKR